jgi:hypothetical protein
VVRAVGVEPTRAFAALRIFMPSAAFAARMRALSERSRQVCGLDYPFTLPRKIRGLGAARLVSTPSRRKFPSGLGSGLPLQVSPNLSSSASPVSQASTQVFP